MLEWIVIDGFTNHVGKAGDLEMLQAIKSKAFHVMLKDQFAKASWKEFEEAVDECFLMDTVMFWQAGLCIRRSRQDQAELIEYEDFLTFTGDAISKICGILFWWKCQPFKRSPSSCFAKLSICWARVPDL